jgi:hypothetical protein
MSKEKQISDRRTEQYPDPVLRNIVEEEICFGEQRTVEEIARRVADRTHVDLVREFYEEALQLYVRKEHYLLARQAQS